MYHQHWLRDGRRHVELATTESNNRVKHQCHDVQNIHYGMLKKSWYHMMRVLSDID